MIRLCCDAVICKIIAYMASTSKTVVLETVTTLSVVKTRLLLTVLNYSNCPSVLKNNTYCYWVSLHHNITSSHRHPSAYTHLYKGLNELRFQTLGIQIRKSALAFTEQCTCNLTPLCIAHVWYLQSTLSIVPSAVCYHFKFSEQPRWNKKQKKLCFSFVSLSFSYELSLD